MNVSVDQMWELVIIMGGALVVVGVCLILRSYGEIFYEALSSPEIGEPQDEDEDEDVIEED